MSALNSTALERLRPENEPRPQRIQPQDAEVWIAPRFWVLLLIAIAAILIQSTLGHFFSLRGATVSLLTVLLVWTGLRCGVTTGGFLGLIAGLIEDALGGGGTSVLGTTLVGFGAGMLNTRFFADSLPVFVSAVAGATVVRALATAIVLEAGFGERGLLHRSSHLLVWQILLNVAAGALTLFVLRAIARVRK